MRGYPVRCIGMALTVLVAVACRGHDKEQSSKIKRAATTAPSASASASVSPQPSPTIEIALLGPYLPFDEKADDETNPRWWRNRFDEKWLALCRVDGAFRLVPTRVDVAASNVDGNPNGLTVSTASCPDAVVLVRGLPASQGPLSTATVERKSGPEERNTVWQLELLGQGYGLYFENAPGLPLMLRHGTRTQELRNWKEAAAGLAEPNSDRNDWGFASRVNVLWAGDVNGDGQLDLLLEQGDAEIGVSVELYLSNGDGAEPRLRMVDAFVSGAC